MKVQLATLALAEKGYMVFKLHMHDDLHQELVSAGKDPLVTLRNALSRHLKRRFGRPSWFFFVMEEHTTAGNPTRPHAHGSIEIRPLRLDPDDKSMPLKWRRLIARKGLAQAQHEAGLQLTIEALRAASGNAGDRSRIARTSGIDQVRNLWRRRPYLPVFNSEWVDYAFKNAKRVSKTLRENRLVLPYDLRGEAQRLWRLVRDGEPALVEWEGR
jgi:hypothetical protein